jgi:2-Cys peroxiredoxin 5
MRPILNGSRVPAVMLGRLENNAIRTVSTAELFAYGQAVIMGIPGAFTPVCTQLHIPEFVQSADRLIAAGCSHLVCITPNDPYVLDAWAQRVDPKSKIEFYSDGNLKFTRALGLLEQVQHHYLGWRSSRYLMVTSDGVIQRLRVEKDATDYRCTRPRQLFGVDTAE